MADGRDVLESIDDPFVQKAVRASVHIRRYLPFYVFSLVWALMLAAFPTIAGLGGDDQVAGGVATLDARGRRTTGTNATVGTSDTTDGGGAVGSGGSSTPSASGHSGGTGGSGPVASGEAAAPAPGISAGESIAASQDASGVSRSGVECAPGVRQIPVSAYATQCTRAFEGGNGGATYRGVTDDKIVIVRREFPDSANSQAADQINAQAGFASDDVADRVRDQFIEYFDQNFELYGRSVEIIEYTSENGDSTEEAQSRGREGACADATKIAREMGAFGVVGGSQPFSECAAERGLVVFGGAAYFPEQLYERHHPFIWHRTMECERISYQVAEYVGKRLHQRNAKWAGDALYQQQERVFGTYVPDNDGYQHCVQISEDVGARDYGVEIESRYNYQLDLARFPDQAAQAAVQFKAAGVTTLILACDPYSVVFLTQAAARQEWRPEWFLIGVAATDTDNFGDLYEPTEVDGHMFGMSQLGATDKLLGADSEPGRMYQHITGQQIPDGTTGNYFDYVHIFSFLQAAGPGLTPDAIGAGAMTIPPGGAPDYPAGYWSWADGSDGTPGAGDHTAIDDSREIYWNGDTFVETYNGKRFRNGEWPAEEPPVYPAG